MPPVSFAIRPMTAADARAIAVYERAGFEATERYTQATNGALHDVVRMTRGPL